MMDTIYKFDEETKTYKPYVEKEMLPMSQFEISLKLGRFGKMRLEYIKEKRPEVFHIKLSMNTLYNELENIDKEAGDLYGQVMFAYRKRNKNELGFYGNIQICESAHEFAMETVVQDIIMRPISLF